MKNIPSHWTFMIPILLLFAISVHAQVSFYSATPSTRSVTPNSEDLPDIVVTPMRQGNFIIGTGIGFSTAYSTVDINGGSNDFDGDGGYSTQVNFSPSLGYFFANNFAFGVGMEFIGTRSSIPEDLTDPGSPKTESINTDLLFGPFARIYFPFSSEDKAFFLNTALGFGSSRDEFDSDGGSQTVNNNILTLGIGPGFTIMAGDGLALESIISYNYARSESDLLLDNVQRSSITRTNAFDFSVGIRYYFGGFRSINNE